MDRPFKLEFNKMLELYGDESSSHEPLAHSIKVKSSGVTGRDVVDICATLRPACRGFV